MPFSSQACHRDRERGTSLPSGAVALLGAELVADAGGLPEAAAELAQALRTPRLVACVADGAIGPWGNPEGRLVGRIFDDFCWYGKVIRF